MRSYMMFRTSTELSETFHKQSVTMMLGCCNYVEMENKAHGIDVDDVYALA
jgi:hypothetical protein